jgi:anti-sigma factor RsiW
MQINRTNYENFFLLYVDGELSTLEMQAVERFAMENSDLAAELDALLETKLSEETSISFLDKEILYRTASNTINEINYEEQFLLFLDNELTEKENAQTKAFLVAHPELQTAFEQLQQTKLPEETLSFGDKSVLYQKEENKPVVFAWWRMAVAAAMIGLMVLVWNLVPTGKQVDPMVKSGKLETLPTKINESKPKVAEASMNNESLANQNTKANQVPMSNNNKTVITELAANSNNASNILPKNDDNANATEIAIIEQPINTTIANNTVPTNLDNADHANQLGHATASPDGSNDATIFQQTVYKELDTDDENKSLYLGNLELNRDKLRGFFRKAGNLFKSKIKSEDDRNENANPRALK